MIAHGASAFFSFQAWQGVGRNAATSQMAGGYTWTTCSIAHLGANGCSQVPVWGGPQARDLRPWWSQPGGTTLALLCSSDSGSHSTPKESGSFLWFGTSLHAHGLERGQRLRPPAHPLYPVEGEGPYRALSVSALSLEDYSIQGWGPDFSPTLCTLTRTPDLQPRPTTE